MNGNCPRVQPIGWYCTRDPEFLGHSGPCALRPRWWNIPAKIRFGWAA